MPESTEYGVRYADGRIEAFASLHIARLEVQRIDSPHVWIVIRTVSKWYRAT